jgi:hypothetical protein
MQSNFCRGLEPLAKANPALGQTDTNVLLVQEKKLQNVNCDQTGNGNNTKTKVNENFNKAYLFNIEAKQTCLFINKKYFEAKQTYSFTEI